MITYRVANDGDNDLIYGAWMRKFKQTCRMTGYIHNETYYDSVREYTRAALSASEHPLERAIIAEAEGAALGFIVATARDGEQTVTVHWLHVKPEFRKLGIGRALVAYVSPGAKRIDFAAPTPYIQVIRDTVNRETYYNPFAMRTA